MSKVTRLGTRTVAYFPSLRNISQRIKSSTERTLSVGVSRRQTTQRTKLTPSDMHGFSKEFPLPGAVSIGNSQFIEPNLSDSVLQYPGSLGSYDRAKVEVSVVQCPSYLHHGFMELFSGVDVKKGNLCIVIFSECTENDMSSWSTAVEEEREELTKHFIEISKEVCSKLLAEGYWADFIDPSCGRAFYSPHSHNILMETDDRFSLLGFNVVDLGCCKAISHPKWNTFAFVGALFTDAPSDSLSLSF